MQEELCHTDSTRETCSYSKNPVVQIPPSTPGKDLDSLDLVFSVMMYVCRARSVSWKISSDKDLRSSRSYGFRDEMLCKKSCVIQIPPGKLVLTQRTPSCRFHPANMMQVVNITWIRGLSAPRHLHIKKNENLTCPTCGNTVSVNRLVPIGVDVHVLPLPFHFELLVAWPDPAWYFGDSRNPLLNQKPSDNWMEVHVGGWLSRTLPLPSAALPSQ